MKKYKIQIAFIVAMIIIWEIVYRCRVFPELMFPSLLSVFSSLIEGFIENNLGQMALYSLTLIAKGLVIGIMLAFIFSSIAIINSSFYSIYNLLISIFDLIPGVALIPLAILWFGIGEAPIIFIVIHSMLWPMSRNIIDGFCSVPKIYIEAGKNMGLSKWKLVWNVYIPASFANILSGIKIGWARAWRGLISAEMIFGTTSAGAGIGWFILTKRTNVDISGVFAALFVIICIGIVVEYGFFRIIENKTVKKWGVH